MARVTASISLCPVWKASCHSPKSATAARNAYQHAQRADDQADGITKQT